MNSQEHQILELLQLLRSFIADLTKIKSQNIDSLVKLTADLETFDSGSIAVNSVPEVGPKTKRILASLTGVVASLRLPIEHHSSRERIAAYAARLASGKPMKMDQDIFDTIYFADFGVEIHKSNGQFFILFQQLERDGERDVARKYRANITVDQALRAQKSAHDVYEILQQLTDISPYGP